jgi:hypothetical protein
MSETIATPKNDTLGDQAARAVSRAETTADVSVRSAGDAVAKTAEERRKIFNEGFEQATELRRELGAEDMHALMTFASDTHAGMQELQSCLTGLMDGVMRTNLHIAHEIFLVESPRAMLELQQRFLHEYFNAYERGISALIRVANEASEQSRLTPA